MYLTPGEKAVLAQIRVLYATAGARDQQIKALQMQWTPSHYGAYQEAFGGLLAKQLEGHRGRNTTRELEAVVEWRRIELPTFALRTRRSPS